MAALPRNVPRGTARFPFPISREARRDQGNSPFQSKKKNMATGRYNDAQSVAFKSKQYAAQAGARNLVTDSPDGVTCARKLKILGAGSFTSLKDGANNDLGTFGPFAAGDEHTQSTSEVVSADAAFIAYR